MGHVLGLTGGRSVGTSLSEVPMTESWHTRHSSHAVLPQPQHSTCVTSSYEFDSLAIENVWRDVKGQVVLKYFPRHTIGETRTQLLRAFKTRIDGEFCNKLIISSEKYLNQYSRL